MFMYSFCSKGTSTAVNLESGDDQTEDLLDDDDKSLFAPEKKGHKNQLNILPDEKLINLFHTELESRIPEIRNGLLVYVFFYFSELNATDTWSKMMKFYDVNKLRKKALTRLHPLDPSI